MQIVSTPDPGQVDSLVVVGRACMYGSVPMECTLNGDPVGMETMLSCCDDADLCNKAGHVCVNIQLFMTVLGCIVLCFIT